jgi:hypothetical protein
MVARGRRLVAVAIGGAVVALALAGCGDGTSPPEAKTIPPGPEVSPPSAPPISPSSAPSLPVDTKAGCVTTDQVIVALTYADPDSAPPPQTTLSRGPVCAAGWAFAEVTVPGKEPASAVLRHAAGRWQVLTYGTSPCAEPRLGDAPPQVRTAAGC